MTTSFSPSPSTPKGFLVICHWIQDFLKWSAKFSVDKLLRNTSFINVIILHFPCLKTTLNFLLPFLSFPSSSLTQNMLYPFHLLFFQSFFLLSLLAKDLLHIFHSSLLYILYSNSEDFSWDQGFQDADYRYTQDIYSMLMRNAYIFGFIHLILLQKPIKSLSRSFSNID